MKKFLLVAIIALVTPTVASASGTSQYVSITSVTQVTGHAQVSWTLAPGWCSNVIGVASSPATGSDGSFFSENYVDGGILQGNQTSWLSSVAAIVPWANLYAPRDYFVRVEAYACDFSAGPEWSDTATITVPPLALNAPVALTAKNVSLEIMDHNTFASVRAVKIGQTLNVAAYARVPIQQYSDFLQKGQICVARKAAPLCRLVGNATGTPAPWGSGQFWKVRVSAPMVAAGKFSIYVAYGGQTITRRTFPVLNRKV